MTFIFEPSSELPGVIKISGKRFVDSRGFFSEIFRADSFSDHSIPTFVQINHSRSCGNCVRGLHYQLPPFAQAKLVYCISGDILDVVVDIRKDSPTYKKYIKIPLGNSSSTMAVYIPRGFAHGFYTYNNAEVIYQVSEYYSPEHDRCIRWDDPDIDIDWVLVNPNVSDKDARASFLKDADVF